MKLLSRFAFTFLALAFLFGWQAREEARRQGSWVGKPVGFGIAAVVLAGLGGFALRQRHARRDDSLR
jgi:hypothetical protein